MAMDDPTGPGVRAHLGAHPGRKSKGPWSNHRPRFERHVVAIAVGFNIFIPQSGHPTINSQAPVLARQRPHDRGDASALA